MTMMYTDRINFTFNGIEVIPAGNISTFSDDYDADVRPVAGMTTNKKMSGFVKGNDEYTFTIGSFVPNTSSPSSLDFSSFDYETNNVIVTVQASSNSYGPQTYDGPKKVYTGVVFSREGNSVPGPGNPAVNTYVFRALDRVVI